MEDAKGTPVTFDRVYDFCPRCGAAASGRATTEHCPKT
jgi:hypothetical protein